MIKKPVLLLLLTMILAMSCEFFIEDKKSTPEARMEAFMEDVNTGNWNAMRRYFHQECEDYDSSFYTNDNVIRDIFEAHVPLTGLHVSSKTATCSSNPDRTEFFFMLIEEEPDNFKIRYIDKTEEVFKSVH